MAETAAIEHARIEDLAHIPHDPAEVNPLVMEEFAKHLEHFARRVPGDTVPCLKCGKDQNACFRWGLQHGVGACTGCGWPARLFHFVKTADAPEARIIVLLQYHPDYVGTRRKRARNRKPSQPAVSLISSVPDEFHDPEPER